MDHKTPILSIVIPTWNRELEIIKALNSLEALAHAESFEIVVTDNCSSDNTVRAVENYKNTSSLPIKIITSNSNNGPALNWIRGINLSRGIYTLLLFSDDFLDFSTFEASKFLESLSILDSLEVKLIRLPVSIVDSSYIPSPDPSIALKYDTNDGPFYNISSALNFLINHLSPGFIKRHHLDSTFSPVSPCGYIIEKQTFLSMLVKYSSNLRFIKNGAGIDELSILGSAASSELVGFLAFPTSMMVASDTSITNIAFSNRNKRLILQKQYTYSRLLLFKSFPSLLFVPKLFLSFLFSSLKFIHLTLSLAFNAAINR